MATGGQWSSPAYSPTNVSDEKDIKPVNDELSSLTRDTIQNIM